MTPIGDGPGSYLSLLLAGVLAHEPWRWLGLALGRNIDPDGELFRWVRAVSSALVAGLVMRLVLFPAGALASVGMPIRLGAFVIGIAAFLALRRNVALGVLTGAGALALAQGLSGALRSFN